MLRRAAPLAFLFVSGAGLALVAVGHPRAGAAVLGGVAAGGVARLAWLLRRARGERLALQRTATAGLVSAGLAHELKNSLMVLQGFAQLARTSAERARAGEPTLSHLREVEAGAARSVEALRRFVDFASGEPAPRERVDAATLGAESLALVRPMAQMRELAVASALAQGLPVECDPTGVQQILLNLLLNALDFARSRVALSVAQEGRSVLFAVEDDGPGIPPAGRARLFEAFRSGREGGNGLGLATSLQLARAQGGTLEVEDLAGGGARFVLRLPAAPVV